MESKERIREWKRVRGSDGRVNIKQKGEPRLESKETAKWRGRWGKKGE